MLDKARTSRGGSQDGKKALEMLEVLPYDLVFMDCHMPEMDG